ncbi:hypothetical protein LP420_06160 [Massilia sp. B-10]|nr:hypothetical protein LP420_06160 [Massilia sp. B-10]
MPLLRHGPRARQLGTDGDDDGHLFAKYALAVALAIQPQAADNAVFAATACALFGVFSGYFLGCLARDMGAIPRTGKLRQAAIEPSMP